MSVLKQIMTPPEETIGETGKRAVLLFWIALAAALCAINALAYLEVENRPRNRGYEVVSHKWELAMTAEAPVDLLFVGDSTCNQGIMPTVFAEETGERPARLLEPRAGRLLHRERRKPRRRRDGSHVGRLASRARRWADGHALHHART